MSQIEQVNAAWERIEKWYATHFPAHELPVGASAADITALETHLGLALPEELKASLMRHNGLERWTRGELLSTEGIKSEWSELAFELDHGTFDDWELQENDFIQKCWFHKSWIPVDWDGGGNGFYIDMNPGPKGKAGQMIFLEHEVGPEGPHFPDFVAYLEDAAGKLEAGKFKVEGEHLEEIE